MGTFRFKSDSRNHQAIVQPRLYDSAMVTLITLTWTGNLARDPRSYRIVFFRTVDMATTGRWKHLPAEFDKHQAKAYSLWHSLIPILATQPVETPSQIRSSGLGQFTADLHRLNS